MSIYLKVNTQESGYIPTTRDLSNSATGGAALVTGTATAVAAGSLTTSGSGTGVAFTVQVAGGLIAAITVTSLGENYKVGDTITVPVAASGGTGESQWGSDIVITLTTADVDEGQATLNIPLDHYGCVDPQSGFLDTCDIDLLQPGRQARYKLTFIGISTSNESLVAAAISEACRDAITSTSDVLLNPYLPSGIIPVQVEYALS